MPFKCKVVEEEARICNVNEIRRSSLGAYAVIVELYNSANVLRADDETIEQLEENLIVYRLQIQSRMAMSF